MEIEIKRDKPSNKQVVMDYLQGHRELEDLTATQLKYYETLRAIYAKLMQVKPLVSKKEILDFLTKEIGLSQNSAFRYYNDAEHVFGIFNKIDKNIHRQRAMAMAEAAYNLAEKKQKPREMTMAAKAYIEAGGLNREDADLPDFGKMDASLVLVVLPDEQQSIIDGLLGAGSVKLNNLPNQTIDVPHEEV